MRFGSFCGPDCAQTGALTDSFDLAGFFGGAEPAIISVDVAIAAIAIRGIELRLCG